MPRIYRYAFVIECQSEGEPDLDRVEELLDLSMQDLVYDDEFIAALDEKEAVSIQIVKLDR
jgi:hypothetical protein